MKKILCFVLCAIMVCGLAACGAKSVVGKWEFGVNTFAFEKDGTFSSEFNGMSQTGTYTDEDGKLTLTYTNLLGLESTTELTYTLKGNTLTLTGDISLLGAASMTVEFTKAK